MSIGRQRKEMLWNVLRKNPAQEQLASFVNEAASNAFIRINDLRVGVQDDGGNSGYIGFLDGPMLQIKASEANEAEGEETRRGVVTVNGGAFHVPGLLDVCADRILLKNPEGLVEVHSKQFKVRGGGTATFESPVTMVRGAKVMDKLHVMKDCHTVMEGPLQVNGPSLEVDAVYTRLRGQLRIEGGSVTLDTDVPRLVAPKTTFDIGPLNTSNVSVAKGGALTMGGDDDDSIRLCEKDGLVLNGGSRIQTNGGDILVMGDGCIGIGTIDPMCSLDIARGDLVIRGGRLGIGTHRPDAALDVRGQAHISEDVYIQGSLHTKGALQVDAVVQVGSQHLFEVDPQKRIVTMNEAVLDLRCVNGTTALDIHSGDLRIHSGRLSIGPVQAAAAAAAAAAAFAVQGNIYASGSAHIDGEWVSKGNIVCESSLTAKNNIQCRGAIHCDGPVTCQGPLMVTTDAGMTCKGGLHCVQSIHTDAWVNSELGICVGETNRLTPDRLEIGEKSYWSPQEGLAVYQGNAHFEHSVSIKESLTVGPKTHNICVPLERKQRCLKLLEVPMNDLRYVNITGHIFNESGDVLEFDLDVSRSFRTKTMTTKGRLYGGNRNDIHIVDAFQIVFYNTRTTGATGVIIIACLHLSEKYSLGARFDLLVFGPAGPDATPATAIEYMDPIAIKRMQVVWTATSHTTQQEVLDEAVLVRPRLGIGVSHVPQVSLEVNGKTQLNDSLVIQADSQVKGTMTIEGPLVQTVWDRSSTMMCTKLSNALDWIDKIQPVMKLDAANSHETVFGILQTDPKGPRHPAFTNHGKEVSYLEMMALVVQAIKDLKNSFLHTSVVVAAA
jgi:hypothetical protein